MASMSYEDLVRIFNEPEMIKKMRDRLLNGDDWDVDLELAAGLTTVPAPAPTPAPNTNKIGGQAMPAATATPYANREPVEAAKCPVHKVRMVYRPEDGAWRCKMVVDGQPCGFHGYPQVEDVTLLRGHKYTGVIKVYAAPSPTASGEQGTEIFLTLPEIGLVINVTPYIDLNVTEAVQVNDDQSCKVALAFDRIDFAGTS